jgi:hypothetical protein
VKDPQTEPGGAPFSSGGPRNVRGMGDERGLDTSDAAVGLSPATVDKVGKVVALPPEPLVPEKTTFLEGGPIVIGVEQRHITTESLRALYRDNPQHAAAFEARAHQGEVEDAGVSLHILSAASRREYLRFDCFDEDPHYHYISHDDQGMLQNRWVIYDRAANGAMLPWALERLRHHLPAMLAGAGADPAMVRVDPATLERLVDEVAALATA